MNENDKREFNNLLIGSYMMFGKDEPPVQVKRMWWSALEQYDIKSISMAFSKEITTSKFAPTPAGVINHLRTSDGRPSSDEAWTIATKASNERLTVIWNDDIAEAWGICRELLLDGDKTAARMAFRSAYDRIVDERRSMGVVVKWSASLGADVEGRAEVVSKALTDGLLTNDQAQKYLPSLESDALLLEDMTIDEDTRKRNIEKFKAIVAVLG